LNISRTSHQTDRLPGPAEKEAIIASARETAKEKAKGYLAPFKAIDAFERGLSHDFQADLEVETDLFCDCLVSDVAKNLIGTFLNARSAGRLKRLESMQPRQIKKVGVLGSGVMGSGIVNLLLRGRFETILWDINDAAIENGIASIRRTFAYSIEKKKMTEKDLDTLIQERLRMTRSLPDMKEVDLVIETVLEDMKVKQDLWKKIESICRPDAVFGTNTSALPITEMSSVLSDPGRMIGLHFFNPAERMQLLEIICTRQTSNETLATGVAFSRAVQKVPIVVNDGPGFYVSRQLSALMNGFYLLLADGVDPISVEEAVLDFGMPMGPPSLVDLTGIDVAYHVAKTLESVLGERYVVHPLTEKIYALGLYGRKSGSGWFDYSRDQPVLNKKFMHVVSEYLDQNGITRKRLDKKAILNLLLADAINDASYMIEEGICDSPQDMDLAMIYGTGFPPYRGGLLRYADAWGIKNVYTKLLELQKTGGVRFRPSDLLKTMVAQKRTFYND
jgi:3-hydroxyacyl-CoA dehydrogenase